MTTMSTTPSQPVPATSAVPKTASSARHRSVAPTADERPSVFAHLAHGLRWWLLLFIIACGWDRAVWLAINAGGEPFLAGAERAAEFKALGESLAGVLKLDTHAALDLLQGVAYAAIYLFGRIWIWLALAAVLVFRGWASPNTARVRRGLREGVFVVLVPGLAGLAAEAVKIIVGRLRPEVHDGFYAFSWSLDPSGKGLASSHASVAIAAALAVGVLLPRWRVLLWPLAIACVLSRVLVGAHYASDIVAGTILGVLAYRLVYAWDARNNSGVPIDAGLASRALSAS